MDQQWTQKSFLIFLIYDLGDRDIRGLFEDLKCVFLRLGFHLDVPLSIFGILVNNLIAFFQLALIMRNEESYLVVTFFKEFQLHCLFEA